MADKDPILPNAGAWNRVGKVVHIVEGWKRSRVGPSQHPFSPELYFWAKVTGHEALSGGGSGAYKYAWAEAIRTELGFNTLANGRTGVIADGTFAIRLAEFNTPGGPLADNKAVLIRMSGDALGVTRYTIVDSGSSASKIGKVATYTAGSNTVTLTPCDASGTGTGEADVTCKITLPASRTTCSIVDLMVDDVLVYSEVTDAAGTVLRYLASVPLPISTTKYDVLSVQGTNGLTGFDSVRFKT